MLPASDYVLRIIFVLDSDIYERMDKVRLIDADKLKKEIHCAYSDDLEILEKIDDQPTAYDVDEVIRELKNQSERFQMEAEKSTICYSLGTCANRMLEKAFSFEHAAKIVKRGGIDA